jgi:hypothetical protein
MSQKIIYRTPEGGVAVITPTAEALNSYSIEQIADKDVPAGLAFKIVDEDVIPSDRTFRDAWEVDPTTLTDGVGSEYDVFIDDPRHPDYVAPVEESDGFGGEYDAFIDDPQHPNYVAPVEVSE